MPINRLARPLLLLVMSMACALSAQAAEVRWKKEKFVYTAQGKNIREFMREFGVSQGLNVVVAKEVEGTVNGKFDLLPESLMALMSANFGFVWYYDGNVLSIYPPSIMRSEVVRLNNASTEQLRAALERLEIPDHRYPISYDARNSTALVSGPGPYVDRVIQTARAISQSPGGGAAVRLVPLKYAWANDVTFTQGGQEKTIPGVATVLNQLYRGQANASSAFAGLLRPRGTLEKLRGLGLIAEQDRNARRRQPVTDTDGAATNPNANAGATSDDLPQFVADGRLNAVLVRDLPERLNAHEASVRALDVKPGLVEIEARIIEVNADEAESLGIDWRLRSRRVDAQVGQGALPRLSFGTALSDGAPAAGPSGQSATPISGGVITTVLGDAGRYLIARVNALALEGKANLLSSPKVMTLDNVEAVMEDLNTFFVRVQGNLDVDLFNVSSGTSLRVTPLVVSEDGEQQVKLAIRIEDGALTARTVDGIPVIRRSTINTQSFIKDGQALLIAGYAQESDTVDKAGVPGLSNIPVLGWLFKSSDKRKTKIERMFLLTPRVVTP
jgi:type III secretion protein C